MSEEFRDDDSVSIEVAFPGDLLDEMEEYRVTHGYATRSCVVTAALKQ